MLKRYSVKREIATGTVQVTTSASTLATLGYTANGSVQEVELNNLSAAEDIYYAAAAGVTADDAATGGRYLGPKDTVVIHADNTDLTALYFVATAAARLRITERS